MMRNIAFVLVALLVISCNECPESAADVSLDQQVKAAEALVGRVTAGRQAEFVVKIVPQQQEGLVCILRR